MPCPRWGSPHHTFLASMAAHVGIDPGKDINFVTHPASELARLLTERKVDALMGFPPVPQELREKKIGHVIVNSGLDRPWSQHFCCVRRGAPGVRPQTSGGDQARAASDLEGNAFLLPPSPSVPPGIVADRGYRYDYALQTMMEISYARWRDYDPEDAVRFYALRLREAGHDQGDPRQDHRARHRLAFYNELKRELKG